MSRLFYWISPKTRCTSPFIAARDSSDWILLKAPASSWASDALIGRPHIHPPPPGPPPPPCAESQPGRTGLDKHLCHTLDSTQCEIAPPFATHRRPILQRGKRALGQGRRKTSPCFLETGTTCSWERRPITIIKDRSLRANWSKTSQSLDSLQQHSIVAPSLHKI